MRLKFKKENLPILLISLAFSLVLFFNVNSSNVSRFFSSDDTYEEVIQNVPVNLVYDDDEYFVHGYTSTVSVKLTSANRIQLTKEVDPDTRDFTIEANLESYQSGTHEVRLKTKNLPTAVTATIDPTTISATIERRQTKEFSIVPSLNANSTGTELTVDQLTIDPGKVEITSGRDTMKEIDRVVASVDGSQLTNDGDKVEAQVQALNVNGEVLPIESNPQTVTVTYDMAQTTKSVDLYPIEEGTRPEGIDGYNIQLTRSTANITGSESAIENVTRIGVPINIDGLDHDTTRMVDIPTDGFSVSPRSVSVQITINRSTETSDNTEENAGSSSSVQNEEPNQQQPESSDSSNQSGTETSQSQTVQSSN